MNQNSFAYESKRFCCVIACSVAAMLNGCNREFANLEKVSTAEEEEETMRDISRAFGSYTVEFFDENDDKLRTSDLDDDFANVKTIIVTTDRGERVSHEVINTKNIRYLLRE